jgi:signal transduction histidine kinase
MEREREQLIQELNAYAHTVAHDLKNPIQILMGYSEVLLEGLQEIPEDQVRHFLSIINSTSHKMRSIIDELLLLAGVRNLTEVKIAPIDMAVVTQGALDRLQKAISDADAVLTLPDRWPVAYGYAPWIEEVWSNYISNAIKYGGEPPHIELGATLLEGDMVQFWVRDYGPGIAAENLHYLFDQFTRLDGTRAEGHGLGLSIVKRIMDKLNGDVGVESIPGTGSVFSFLLPQHPVAEES